MRVRVRAGGDLKRSCALRRRRNAPSPGSTVSVYKLIPGSSEGLMEVSLLELLSVELNCSLADAFGDAASGNASGARLSVR